MAKKKESLSLEERLEKALLSDSEQPYKVPSNWVWTRLSEVVSIKTGKKDANYATDDGQYNFFTCAAEPLKCDDYSFDGESILVAGNGANVGLSLYFYGKFEAYQRTYVLQKGVKSELSIKFIFYHLQGFWEEYNKDKQYGSATNYIKMGNFKNYPIPLPPLGEQQRIVDCIESLFSKLDAAKENVQTVLDSFEKNKANILHKAFTGELTIKWREENGVSLDSWEETTLGLVCQINPKRVDTKNIDDSTIVTFVPMPSVSDVLGEIVKPLSEKLQKVKKGYTNFCTDDVIFAKITPCMENGKSAVVGTLENNIGFGSTEFHVIRCNANIFNRYIYHLVRWKKFRDEAKAVMTGAVGQQRVPTAFLEEYPLNLPTFDEQIEIVRILDNIFEKEQQAKELANIIEKIDLMKKAILTRAFRGELGTNDPEEESAVELLREILEVKS